MTGQATHLYNGPIVNVHHGEQQPSSESADGTTAREARETTNQSLSYVLFLITTGSIFSVVRRFE